MFKPYPVSKLHKETFKNDDERVVLLRGLKRANVLEWVDPSNAQPEHKSY